MISWLKLTMTTIPVAAMLFATTDIKADEHRSGGNSDTAFSRFVDSDGNISRPEGFRKNWSHLGSWLVKDDEHASGPGVHDVYTEASSVEAFNKNGEWPDGATIVKEIRGIESKTLTTGNAQWAGEPAVWFVMVRDRNNRFPDNKAWGEGWGWALFEAAAPDKNVTTTWKGTGFNNCFGCHAPAAATEWVFIDGYPTIRAAAKYSANDD